MHHDERLLVLGIGNLIMGDEGVGVHTARALEAVDLPPGIDVLDGGTGGFHLLSSLTDNARVVIVDAVLDGQPPGTVSVLTPRFLEDFPRSLGAHDVGLRDLIESAALLGPLPQIRLITVSIARVEQGVAQLSPAVQQAIGPLCQVILEIITNWHQQAPSPPEMIARTPEASGYRASGNVSPGARGKAELAPDLGGSNPGAGSGLPRAPDTRSGHGYSDSQ